MRSWIASLMFWLLSGAVVYWLSAELGVSGYSTGFAGDSKSVELSPLSRAYQDKLKEVDRRENEVARKERDLNEKEKALRDQTERYDKLLKKHEALSLDLENRIKITIEKEAVEVAAEEKRVQKEGLARKAEEEAARHRRLQSEREQARVERLRATYEKMDPKRAGKILGEMDVKLASALIGSMKQDRAAEILSRMSVEQAKRISEYVSDRSLSSVSETPVAESKESEQ